MRIIGNDPSVPRQTQEVASGTLPNGKPVVVNADGTVSVVDGSSADQAIGSTVVFKNSNILSENTATTFDSNSNKVVVVYDNTSNGYGTAIVGTVSGTSISFGSPVTFESANTEFYTATFDSNSNKVVIAYKDLANSSNGTAIVGTVSGTSISFGSPTVFESGTTNNMSATFDSNSNKVVIAYRDSSDSNYGKIIVGTVSGTSISFGSIVVFNSATSTSNSVVFDSSNNKVVLLYTDGGNSSYGTAKVGTVSGTSISFGSAAIFSNNQIAFHTSSTFDSVLNKIVVAFVSDYSNTYGRAVVGTVSGTSISFGTPVDFDSAHIPSISFNSTANKCIIAYKDKNNSDYGTIVEGTVSGTSISFGSPVVFEAAEIYNLSTVFDSNSKVVSINYIDAGNSNYGTSVIFQSAYTSTNITSENYIGMSSGTAFQTGSAVSVGSATVYNAGAVEDTGAAFDSNSNKIVIAFRDAGDSNKGKAIVGTVSGSSISFGSEVTFNNGSTDGSSENISVAFDSTNKVIIAYRDVAAGSPFPLKCIVGTVSGTSISFGSAATVKDCNPTGMSLAYDSSAGKVVVAFGDGSNSGYGTAAVGTVSGTSISFGSLVVFANSETYYASLAYDSNAQKIVAVYQNSTSSGHGTAIVGTVSGTSISFGSAVVYNSAETNVQAIAYDASAQKVVIAYRNNGNSSYGTGIVGTVSGTSISFGSAVVFESNAITDIVAVYYAKDEKPVFLYSKEGSSNEGTAIVGTVSGTSISFGSSTEFESDSALHIASAYDSNAEKLVISYRDGGNSNYGTARVFQPDTRETTRGQVADGGHALVDTQGAISDNQIGLTAGQSYYVQIDGTLGTTAADPSVFAGTAVSATKLIVKG